MDQSPLRLSHRFNVDMMVTMLKMQLWARIELMAERAHAARIEQVRWAREHINRVAGQHIRYQREKSWPHSTK